MNLILPDFQALSSATIWLAIFPVSYLIHFAEEYWGGEGYPAYLLRLRGVHLSEKRFVALQMLGFVLFVSAGVISTVLKFPQLMTAILSAFVLSNGLSHTMTAIRDGRYGPGLFTSALLWIPVGAASLILMLARISFARFTLAVLIGFAINGVIALVTLRGGRLMGVGKKA